MIYSGSYARPRLNLGQAVMEAMLDESQYIGTQVLPIFGVQLQSAYFSKVTRESLLRRVKTQRAPTAGYSRDQIDAEDDSFLCKEFGHEALLGDEERALYANDLDAEKAAALKATHVLLREQELRIQALIFNTTTWTGASLYTDRSANPWDNVATDIVSHVLAAKEKVRLNCGMPANALILGEAALNNVLNNDDIIARIAGTRLPTRQEIFNSLAPIFGLEKLIVGSSVYNSAAENVAFVGADTWGDDYAMVARVATSNNLDEPCLGRTFLWTADSPKNVTVEEYREETRRSNVYRVRHHVQEKVFDANYAHLLKIDA